MTAIKLSALPPMAKWPVAPLTTTTGVAFGAVATRVPLPATEGIPTPLVVVAVLEVPLVVGELEVPLVEEIALGTALVVLAELKMLAWVLEADCVDKVSPGVLALFTLLVLPLLVEEADVTPFSDLVSTGVAVVVLDWTLDAELPEEVEEGLASRVGVVTLLGVAGGGGGGDDDGLGILAGTEYVCDAGVCTVLGEAVVSKLPELAPTCVLVLSGCTAETGPTGVLLLLPGATTTTGDDMGVERRPLQKLRNCANAGSMSSLAVLFCALAGCSMHCLQTS